MFSENCWFWCFFFFIPQCKAPQKLILFYSKTMYVIVFLHLFKRELHENSPCWKDSSHGLIQQNMQHGPNTPSGAFDLKAHVRKNFKPGATRIEHKMIEQMRDIACFTVLICGSFQLGSLINCSWSVELHRKDTIKLNANHKKAPKWGFDL